MSNEESRHVPLNKRINTADTDPAKANLLSKEERSIYSNNTSFNRSSFSNNNRSATPRASPMRKISSLLMSPVVMFQRKFKAGGTSGSIFSLITAILGAGTISLPYLSAQNGIVMAVILIIFGAAISYFCGMLLVSCAEKVGSDKYEDFAQF